MLEKQVSTLEEKVLQLEKEKEALLARQFSLNKIKGNNAAMLFYTGFPNYKALMSFYNYIEPKVSKMQYWKGEKLLKEIFIQRPSAMLAQSETWSDYKHHNTWKVLVGVTPNGQVSFISDLWGGRVSDKQITRGSGVLNLLEPGDNVMVDRGFDISDIVSNGVIVNMPPFLAGRHQMTGVETQETKSIASLRIHVERAIGRIKTYHILD
ncbi:unnamed protein product, partial [Pocillopora meandrina]